MQSSTVTRAIGRNSKNVTTSRKSVTTTRYATILAVARLYRFIALQRKIKLVVIRMTVALHLAWLSRERLLADLYGGWGRHISRDGATWQALARCARFPSLNAVAAALAPFRRTGHARGCAQTD